VDELTRMGANIRKEGSTAIIEGVEQYTGATLSSPDLRAGAALVIAALAADDFSEIYEIKYIERGYEDFPEKLRKLGAHIEKIDTAEEKKLFMQRER
jgi:UDP-N-acetylglucosamine 1-carboxyvinyltransferase